MANTTSWKTDLYKFVGKSFDYAYNNRLNKMMEIIGKVATNSVDYELTGSEGYGELLPYDGVNIPQGAAKRGFKTVITPAEFALGIPIGFKEAKIDKFGSADRVGTRLGHAASASVYVNMLRLFANAFNPGYKGGDDKPWAATDHPNASLSSSGRKFLPDPESGTYSNLLTQELSIAAITKARTQAGNFVTPDGLPFLCELDLVLVPLELEEKAMKLFGPDRRLTPTKDPESGDNAANPVHDLQYMVVSGGGVGFGPKQWAICDKALMKELCKIVYITEPQTRESQLDNPYLSMHTAYVDYNLGWGDGRQIIFSNPA